MCMEEAESVTSGGSYDTIVILEEIKRLSRCGQISLKIPNKDFVLDRCYTGKKSYIRI